MLDGAWRLDEVAGVLLARCAPLEGVPGIAHAYSTRAAFGRTDFDLGSADGPDGVVRWRRSAFVRAAGLGDAAPAVLRQVHGATIVRAPRVGSAPPEADGVIRSLPSAAGETIPSVRTADCVALLFADRGGRAVAAVHAGWRGTAAGIAAQAVGALRAAGVPPTDLVVGLGPAILGCCYEVGEDVLRAVEAASPGGLVRSGIGPHGKTRIDLHAANRAQLARSGVLEESIHAAPWCTRCRSDLFFSVRAEGAAAGRLMAAVGPAGRP